jgi:hypothetical protein
VRPMPAPGNVLSAAGGVCFQQKARPRRGRAREQRGVNRGNDPSSNNARNLFPRYPMRPSDATQPGGNTCDPNGIGLVATKKRSRRFKCCGGPCSSKNFWISGSRRNSHVLRDWLQPCRRLGGRRSYRRHGESIGR